MSDTSADPMAEFRKVNVEGTLQLARQAADAGVKRFVFVSSIKVNGEGTALGAPYTADAEQALRTAITDSN
jgi:nucleoside-diphosphate-sugar epimerase